MAGNSSRQTGMDAGDDTFTRRDSIAVAGEKYQEELKERLSELRSIWNEVTEDERRERMGTCLNHLKSLLTEVVEEICMRWTLHNSLLVTKKEIEALLEQLHRQKPAFLQDSEGELPLLALNDRCIALRDELVHERNARIGERDRLLREFAHYAIRLDVPDLKFDASVVPDMHGLANLKEDVHRIKVEWESNFKTFREQRSAIAKFTKICLEGFDLTQFQRQVLAGDGQHDTLLVLSRKNMDELGVLLMRLQDKLKTLLKEKHSQLTKWWEVCYIPIAERDNFRTVDPGLDPERAMEQYDEAVAHYRAFYESRKTILDKIGEWESLWQENVSFEKIEQDPSRYKNRAGALLEEERRRNKVSTLLPQVYKQLSTLVTNHDLAHPDEAITMNGMRVLECIDSITRDYEETKRKEKEEKESRKKKQLMVEVRYGSLPNSPESPWMRVSPSAKGGSVSPKPVPCSQDHGVSLRVQPVKRKMLLEPQGDQERQASMADRSGDRQVLRAEGGESQTSCIGPQTQIPTKMARKE